MTPATKKQTALSIIFFLSCLLFSSCNSNKPEENKADNTEGNVLDANQMLEPCRWTFTVEQNTPGEATLIATAKLDSGWHLYSQEEIDMGPLPMKFSFDSLPDYELAGGTAEENVRKEYDPFFDSEVFFFEKEAVFKQKIKVSGKKDFTVTGTVDYQACLTQCVNGAADFSFNVKGNPR